MPAPETHHITAHLLNPPYLPQGIKILVHFAIMPTFDVERHKQILYVLYGHFPRRMTDQPTQELTCGLGRSFHISMKDQSQNRSGREYRQAST